MDENPNVVPLRPFIAPDYDAAEHFLTLLHEGAEALVFQTFDDSKQKRAHLTKILIGTLDEHWDELCKLSAHGAGVYVTVQITDETGRKRENIREVHALYQECDRQGTPEPELEPHVVVETSPGKSHRYFLHESHNNFEKWSAVQQRLVDDFGADPCAKDTARVLRIPGFPHQKNLSNPYLVRIIHESGRQPYTWNEITSVIKPVRRRADNAEIPEGQGLGDVIKIKSALAALDPDMEYRLWLQVGMALHHASRGRDGFELWDEWSRQGKSYRPGEMVHRWKGFGRYKGKQITMRTLWKMASEKGFRWKDPSTEDTQPHYNVTDNGVFWVTADEDGDAKSTRVCTPLWITAKARDGDGNGWSKLLEFSDPDGVSHEWVMPSKLLARETTEFLEELCDQGLEPDPFNERAKLLLRRYIQSATPAARLRVTERTGWFNGAFVLPHTVIGQTVSERIILKDAKSHSNYHASGDLVDWQRAVAALCVDDSRLVLAVSIAFAAPLLDIVGAENGGFHLKGQSSVGKTAALVTAGSVYGGPDYVQTWRTTDNGLEGIAAAHNDTLLPIDELNMVDPRIAGESAYMLANGQGKQRAGRTGAARVRQSWRLLSLSSGEISLAEHMRSVGRRAKAGQEIRLLDIPADTETYGLFNELHGYKSGHELALALRAGVEQYHGTAGLAYLTKLTGMDRSEVKDGLNAAIAAFEAEHSPVGASGQAQRACRRFGLVAAAGELATLLGITGWESSAAREAAKTCFEAWLTGRGGVGQQEEKAVLKQVRAFLELHGDSRFVPTYGKDFPTTNRAGAYRSTPDGGREYLVFPIVFRDEVCKGLDVTYARKVLLANNWLVRDKDDKKPQSLHHIPGVGTVRVYHLDAKAMTDEI